MAARLVVGAVVGLCVVWTAGCHGATAQIASPAEGNAIQDQAVRPMSSEDLGVLAQAEQVLIRDCMTAQNFQYVVPPAQVDVTREVDEFPYGLDDPVRAAKYGFGAPPESNAGKVADPSGPNARYLGGLSEGRRAEYLTALNGGAGDPAVTVALPDGYQITMSTRGCRAGAQEKLYGDFAAWIRARILVDNLTPRIQLRVLEAPVYQRALRSWTACMRTAGHAAVSPDKLRDEFAERAGGRNTAATRALERRLATTEARCARKTGLVSIARQEESRAEATVRAQYREEIRTVARLQSDALPRAGSLVDQE